MHTDMMITNNHQVRFYLLNDRFSEQKSQVMWGYFINP